MEPSGASHAARSRQRALIITADDFGLDVAVNEAVEQAFQHGVLRAASLMVAAPAAADAAARVQRLPGLRVGLHLVLADGAAILPAAQIPDLVDAAGRFGDHMARDGVRFFFLPQVRRQLAAEIRAQFEAFTATGLTLDHVNAHKHFHLHPTILQLILQIGRDYGVRPGQAGVRLPLESTAPWWLKPWMARMRRHLRAAGIRHNDWIAGLSATGAMDEAAVLTALANLREGVTELYLHPATRDQLTPTMPSYRHQAELAALLSPAVAAQIVHSGLSLGGFLDVCGAHSA